MYLLLHGTASGPTTWDALVADKFLGRCPITSTESDITQESTCYRHEFIDQALGDDQWRNGDGSTLTELGIEVTDVIKKIEEKVRPSAIILVGHSRGGLAVRAYLQRISEPPAFKLGLLTIGTPHQGTPLGRAKHWLLDRGFLPKDVPFDTVLPSAEDVYMAKSVLFSPSAGYQATAHKANGKPLRLPISEPIWQLNDGVGRLDDHVSTFGQIFSVELRLGENAFADFDLLDDFDLLARLIPGNFTELRRFVLLNIGRVTRRGAWTCTPGDLSDLNNWACNGDGIAPTISQRMTRITGFSRGNKPLHPKALQAVPHVSETGQIEAIKEVLDLMSNDIN